MTELRKYSKLSSNSSFRRTRFFFFLCSPRNVKCVGSFLILHSASFFRIFPTPTRSSPYFLFSLTVTQQVLKGEVLWTLEPAYETSLKFLVALPKEGRRLSYILRLVSLIVSYQTTLQIAFGLNLTPHSGAFHWRLSLEACIRCVEAGFDCDTGKMLF